MSLALDATRSAVWMLAGGLATKAVALAGSLWLVRYVSPAEYGEAIVAAIAIATASTFSSLGIGQFVIVKARGRRDLAFHATVYQLVLGLAALGLIWSLQGHVAAWVGAPGMGRYLPALALSMLLDRLWFVPERALMRDMRFRPVAVARSAGELAYTVVSCATALLGWGGMAIAAGSVARSAAKAVITISAVDRRDWLEPSPLRREATVELFRFSLPLAVGIIAAFVASRWDNLFVSSFFGPAVMAAYNVAYNLAGMASGLVADHVIDILVPSFARADERARAEGFLRSAALVALLTTPLCIGLAAVAPTMVSALLHARWYAVAPMLSVLSAVATLGPLVGLVFAYLQGCGRPWLTMFVQIVALAGLFGALLTVGRLGPLWACSAVGIGAFLCVVASFLLIRAVDGIPLARLVATQIGPILAALPMIAAVLGARWIWARLGLGAPGPSLAAEICAGGLAYCGAAAVCCREAARDLVGLAQGARLGRRAARGQAVLGSTTDP